jgi:hypothetical protein
MFKNLFSKNKEDTRKLEKPEQLRAGDILVFKYREVLPVHVREKNMAVEKVAGYEYEGGVSKEITLKDEDGNVFFMAISKEDGEEELCLSVQISRQDTLTLFSEDAIAHLWEAEFVTLEAQAEIPQLDGWYTGKYHQTIKEQPAYYYSQDPQDQDLTLLDDGEELRYHECEGQDDRFGVNVEVWSDGSTDIYLQVYCPSDVIQEMWPHADEN